MFAILCFTAVLDTVHLTPGGPSFRPAPIADRWLLKYAPKDLPQLPDRFFDTEWHHGFYPRSLSGGFTEWTKFARDSFTAPPDVVITHAGGEGFRPNDRTVTVRRVPLAVHGPLVEYDGNLHTVALTNWETDATKKSRWALNFGAAVEVKKNVWYQAGSERLTDGKVRVREYRLEFADDPRAKAAGRVKVFASERVADKYEAGLTEADAEFTVSKEERPPRSVAITFRVGEKGKGTVHLRIGDGHYPPVIDGVSRANPGVLTEAPSPAPKPPQPANPPGLMQPPAKPKK